MSTADDARFALASPQAFVFQLIRAHLTEDDRRQAVLFEQIERGGQWELVTLVALAELAQELEEHRGFEGALTWLDERLAVGLDAGGTPLAAQLSA